MEDRYKVGDRVRVRVGEEFRYAKIIAAYIRNQRPVYDLEFENSIDKGFKFTVDDIMYDDREPPAFKVGDEVIVIEPSNNWKHVSVQYVHWSSRNRQWVYDLKNEHGGRVTNLPQDRLKKVEEEEAVTISLKPTWEHTAQCHVMIAMDPGVPAEHRRESKDALIALGSWLDLLVDEIIPRVEQVAAETNETVTRAKMEEIIKKINSHWERLQNLPRK